MSHHEPVDYDVDDDDFDPDEHDGRRNATIAVGVAGVAIVLVGVMFWLMSSFTGPNLVADTTPRIPATSTTTGPAGAAAPETSSVAPPPIASYTPTTTFSLPPPEQPTMSAPAAAPTTVGPTTKAPAPQPAPTAPPSASAPPASVTNVKLTCSKGGGRQTTGTLSFTTTTTVTALVSAGGGGAPKSVGPGDVSITDSGRSPLCFGRINNQIVGPTPAT